MTSNFQLTMHSLTDSNSRLKISSISDTSLLDARSAESSVDKSSLHLTAAFISLTDIKNIRGPRIEPCFTPHVTVLNSEKTPEISTVCYLPPRYESYYFNAAWPTPIALDLDIRIWWFNSIECYLKIQYDHSNVY